MGFTGSFIVARTGQPVTELWAMQAADCLPLWWARDGAWQILKASPGGDPDGSIIAETGAPVLVVHVLDSDFATVQAASPSGPTWQSVLSSKMARDYGFPEQWIGDPDSVTSQAVAWAEEAGLQPDPAAVRAVLVAECDPFAEDLVFALTNALGFWFDTGADLLSLDGE